MPESERAFQVVWVELASSSVGALVPVEECTSGLREPRVEDHVLQTSVKLGHGEEVVVRVGAR